MRPEAFTGREKRQASLCTHAEPFSCPQMIFPALVFLGLKNNDCCGCCGNAGCGKRFAVSWLGQRPERLWGPLLVCAGHYGGAEPAPNQTLGTSGTWLSFDSHWYRRTRLNVSNSTTFILRGIQTLGFTSAQWRQSFRTGGTHRKDRGGAPDFPLPLTT